MAQKKVLLASFYGYIPELVFPEYATLNALNSSEYELHVLQTGENPKVVPGLEVVNQNPMDLDVPIHMSHLKCFESTLRRAYPRFHYHDMSTLLQGDDLLEVQSYVDSLEIAHDLSNFGDISYLGVQIGPSALFRALRAQQLESLEGVDDTTRKGFQDALKCGAFCVILAQRLALEHRFDSVLVSHFNYACSKAFVTSLQAQYPVKLLPITAPNIQGHHLERRLTVIEQDQGWMDRNLATWETIKDSPREDYSLVLDHFENLFKGRSLAGSSTPVTKSKMGIHQRWDLDPSKKILVAAMNSPDEIFAAEQMWGKYRMKFIFPSQIEWLKKLADFFKDREDAYLIIRPHPRSYHRPTGRKTAHLKEIIELSKTFPQNMILNYPWEDVSNHEIMKVCSHLLVSYSTSAFEYGLFGIGTLSYTHEYELAPLWDLGEIPKDEKGYFSRLNQVLNQDYVLDTNLIRTCFRWFFYLMNEMTLDLSPALRYKKHVWSDLVVRMQRTLQKFLHTRTGLVKPYNPIWFKPNVSYPDMKHIRKMIEDNEDLAALKVQESAEATQSGEWTEIRGALDRLARHLFGLPMDLSISYSKEWNGSLDPSMFYLTLKSTLQDERIRVIQKEELLLNQLGQLLYGDPSSGFELRGSNGHLVTRSVMTDSS